MAALPSTMDPTLAAIDAAMIEKSAAEPVRGYLGMSQIGITCERRLWYSFRFAVRESFDAITLKRFDDGFRSEDVMAARLRAVPGIELHAVNPNTGEQFAVKDHGGHFSGHLDGAVLGLMQAPKTWHVWECKAVNEEKFSSLSMLRYEHGEKATLGQWDQTYFAQAQAYMHYTGMSRHYLTVTTPGARLMDAVRTDADPVEGARIVAKAHRVITAAEPLSQISADPNWYECRWCPAQTICHGKRPPAVNCRTCIHATPELLGDARWSCARHKRDIGIAEQRVGCSDHRYIPALVAHSRVVDADETSNWIEYETPAGKRFRNGDPAAGMYSSEELRVADVDVLGDSLIESLKATFGAQIIEPQAVVADAPIERKPFIDWTAPSSRERHGSVA